MLLIHDGEGKGAKSDRGLKQRMGADNHQSFAAGDGLQAGAPLGGGEPPGNRAHFDAQGRKPSREALVMLLHKQFRRRHHRGLAPVLGHANGGERRDDGFAGANVPLQQAQRRPFLLQILKHIGDGAPLRPRERERQIAQQLAPQPLPTRQGTSAMALPFGAAFLHEQVVPRQFVGNDAGVRGLQLRCGGVRRRTMQKGDGVVERREGNLTQLVGKGRGRQHAAALRRSPIQSLFDERTQADAGNAAGRAIHRRLRRFRPFRPVLGRPVLRMHHFAAGRPRPHLSETA